MIIDRPKVGLPRAHRGELPRTRLDRNQVLVQVGERTISLVGHRLTVNCVRATPDGRLVVTGSQDATVRIWALETGQELRCLRGHRLAILDLAISPAGLLLASASLDKTIRIWDLTRGLELACLPGTMPVQKVCFAPDGEHLVSGELFGHIRVWDLRRRCMLAAFACQSLPEQVSACGRFIQLQDGTRIDFSSGQSCGRWKDPQVCS